MNSVTLQSIEKAKKLKRPRAILFDWDNTLADSWPIIFKALQGTFHVMGHEPWSFDDVKRGREGIHHSLRDSFPRIFGDDWERAREVYYKNFLECHIEEISILPQMTDMLNLLSSTDIYLAIVSNKTGKYLREEVEHLGLNHHFDKVVGATDAKADKPHPDPVHLALDGAGIAAGDDVWFIGDSMTDIECAVATNCVPVLFGDNVPMDDPEHVWPIDYAHVLHVKDHNELITLLKEIL